MLGVACLSARPSFAVYLLMSFSIANAAGTFSVGGASIPPVNLFALFFCLRAAILPGGISTSLSSLAPPRPGFLLAILAIYAVLSAIFFPQMLKGATYVLYADRGISEQEGLSARPLASGSGNITQSLYILQGLAIFAVAHAYVRLVSPNIFVRSFQFLALLNIAFAFADVVTYSLGTTFLLEPFRSGGYDIHIGQAAGGIRRIVGTFPEPSAFASFSFQMFVGMFVIWQAGSRQRGTFALMFGNLALVIISTSTTGYGALGVFTLIILSWLTFALLTSGWSPRQQIAVAGVLVGILLVGAMYAFDMVPATVSDILQATLNKSQSDSGIERAAMNVRAWGNFTDTFGIGAGLGSARASSFLLVLLSNLGVIGVVLFFAFAGRLLRRSARMEHSQFLLSALAKSQIVAILICGLLSSGVFDLGVTFYFWCGVASAVSYVGVPFSRQHYEPQRGLPT
ncbi:hypothetical protein [Hyphomicrobium sp. 99]|uniref:hypothetical protein n=1 Tax=Hyphomicrobium sp. 99 TaxID=1163419 RepID=UPI0012E084B1|nr:hypothetical protein [Hyphomicrobium sp. 99]